ncbi:hypothetical protein [Paraburkholderia xenovorans]|uniref:hypothetical protein n=1 Tax=Paraburkholderia xenovorans TaxID=36873 RepID=UPI0015C52FB0|nr:hypothetical protein [Paraburkholderia xenovorans]
MTLDDLRAELERGPLVSSGQHRIEAQAANGRLARRLYALASRPVAGVRLQLPVSSMPVLP